MQLSVEVKQQHGISLYLCRGKLLHGTDSEYLFELLTRSSNQDVILDVAGLSSFDRQGVRALAFSCAYLVSCGRRMLVRCASSPLAMLLRERHGAWFPELCTTDPARLTQPETTAFC